MSYGTCQGCGAELPPTKPTGRPRKWCSQRCRKQTLYTGTCIDCGGRTGWSGTSTPPERCASCSPEFRAKQNRELARQWIMDAIQEWAELYGEPPAIPDWNAWQARHELGDEARAVRHEGSGWPSHTTVYYHFGSWGAALEAAGFDARPAHGGGGNQLRRRSMRAKDMAA